ncbi:MAG: winged helix-turn-helix transcriptional regulator [Bacteroidales bacterium]|nr:winged helix-turn-helix transcriptional regulator [Bacteroidales bacterium]
MGQLNAPKNDNGKSIVKSAVKILSFMKHDPNITIPELCEITGLSDRGVRNNIDKLKQQGLITRVGPDKGGHWQVNCENNSI